MWKPDAALTPLFHDDGHTDKSTLFTVREVRNCVSLLAYYFARNMAAFTHSLDRTDIDAAGRFLWAQGR